MLALHDELELFVEVLLDAIDGVLDERDLHALLLAREQLELVVEEGRVAVEQRADGALEGQVDQARKEIAGGIAGGRVGLLLLALALLARLLLVVLDELADVLAPDHVVHELGVGLLRRHLDATQLLHALQILELVATPLAQRIVLDEQVRIERLCCCVCVCFVN